MPKIGSKRTGDNILNNNDSSVKMNSAKFTVGSTLKNHLDLKEELGAHKFLYKYGLLELDKVRRKRRSEEGVKLRKERRNRHLAKKRNIGSGTFFFYLILYMS